MIDWKFLNAVLLTHIFSFLVNPGSASAQSCPTGWLLNDDKCYKFELGAKTWLQARAACLTDGGDLTSIAGSTEDRFIATQTKQLPLGRFWIGLNDQAQEGLFEWSDNSSVGYTHWEQGEPNDHRRAEDCAEYFWRVPMWEVDECHFNLSYVCKKKKDASPSPCPSGWQANENRCYKFVQTRKTWWRARVDCLASGADLVSITSSSDEDFLQSITTQSAGMRLWIGLNDRFKEGAFTWSDNSSAAYRLSNGAFGDNGEDCVTFRWRRSHWIDKYCGKKLPYICKQARDNNSLPCSNGWHQYGNYCYEFVKTESSWHKARQHCMNKTSDLVSIANITEEDFLHSETTKLSLPRVWIGFNDEQHEGVFEWSDNSSSSYTNWGNGEPSNHGNNEHCAAIYWARPEWAVRNCDGNKLRFICKKSRAQSPACPPGWQDHQNHCYYFSLTRKMWREARQECKANGSELASIANSTEETFLAVQVQQLEQGRFWIGFNDRSQEGVFEWSDNSSVSYKFWTGEFSDNNRDCVHFQWDWPRWNDRKCSVLNGGYICKIDLSKRINESEQCKNDIGKLQTTGSASSTGFLQEREDVWSRCGEYRDTGSNGTNAGDQVIMLKVNASDLGNRSSYHLAGNRFELDLPREIFRNQETTILSVLSTDAAQRLPEVTHRQVDGKTGSNMIVSPLLTVIVRPPPPPILDNDITITIAHSKNSSGTPQFVFWNSSLNSAGSPGSWSTRGCSVEQSNQTTTVGSCNHLTTFAVLMQVSEQRPSSEHQLVLDVIFYIGCALSLAGELLAILAYLLLFDLGRSGSISVRVRLNLFISLLAAQVTFLAGIESTDNKAACVLVSALLHYLYLVAMDWMLVEGVVMYTKIVTVFGAFTKPALFCAFAWGFPLVVVVLSIIIASTSPGGIHGNYMQSNICWLSTSNDLVWTFAIPVVLISSLNICILILVVRELSKLQSLGNEEVNKIRQAVRAAVLIAPVLGVSWIFGLLAVGGAGLAFTYIFNILNSAQGFLIFVFQVLMSREVRVAYELKKQKWLANNRVHQIQLGNSTQSKVDTI